MESYHNTVICAFTAMYLIVLAYGMYSVFLKFTRNLSRIDEPDDGTEADHTDPDPAYDAFAMCRGVELIHTERLRQMTFEGFTAEHDDRHDHGELAKAAACYALHNFRDWFHYRSGNSTSFWPFANDEFKASDTDDLRNMVKAGALIAAEIDRILRYRRDNAELLSSLALREPMLASAEEQ